jgi:hypothetical protein
VADYGRDEYEITEEREERERQEREARIRAQMASERAAQAADALIEKAKSRATAIGVNVEEIRADAYQDGFNEGSRTAYRAIQTRLNEEVIRSAYGIPAALVSAVEGRRRAAEDTISTYGDDPAGWPQAERERLEREGAARFAGAPEPPDDDLTREARAGVLAGIRRDYQAHHGPRRTGLVGLLTGRRKTPQK